VPRKSSAFFVLAAFALTPLAGMWCAWSCAGEHAVETAEMAQASRGRDTTGGLTAAIGTDDGCGPYELQPAVPARVTHSAPVATWESARTSPTPMVIPLSTALAITPRSGAPPGAHANLFLRI
jgi:hypothetical protein